MNSKTNFAASIAANVLVVATQTMGVERAKSELAINIASAFASVPVGNMKAFAALFGNGDAPKSKTYLPGSIAVAVREAIAKVAKPKQVLALNILKTRLSECRRAFKAGLVLGADENVQAACKRIAKAKTTTSPEVKADVDRIGWAIPPNAELADVVEQFSQWIGRHTDASRAVAAALTDCLPITIKPNRKSA